MQAAHKWGREEDLPNGNMDFSYWGMPDHGYDPRAELEWGYGSILGDRDICEHCFNIIFTQRHVRLRLRDADAPPGRRAGRDHRRKLSPYAKNRPDVLDYGDENMYGERRAARPLAPALHALLQAVGALLRPAVARLLQHQHADPRGGATASDDAGEHVFWNAVTGDKLTFDDGIEMGRRIWNLDNAIWTLQGRHRDMVHFSPYIYETRFEKGELFPFYMWPCRDKDEWVYRDLMGRTLDRRSSRSSRRPSTGSRVGIRRAGGRRAGSSSRWT